MVEQKGMKGAGVMASVALERLTPKVTKKVTLEAGALLLAHGGLLPNDDLARFLLRNKEVAEGEEKPMSQAGKIMRPLRLAGLTARIGGMWHAPSLADLAAWIADGYEERDDAGCGNDPPAPKQPKPRNRGRARRGEPPLEPVNLADDDGDGDDDE
jgi:hypothetical protein